MKQVNLLLKPASGRCNMRCQYCFYGDLMRLRSVPDCGMMTMDTAEKLICSAFEAVSPGGEVSFAFQGGEPTLAGLDFYRGFLELELRWRRPDVRVTHAIQTNGLLIDEEWAEFLAEHEFLVGLSLDGVNDLHNFARIDAFGKGTWSRAAGALKRLQKYGAEVNALCVVTAQCARSPIRVYNQLKKLGFLYLQFIPCLNPLEGSHDEFFYSLNPESYGKFLCQLFDAWYRDWESGQYVSIRLFDDYVHLMMGLPAGACSTTGNCGSYVVSEADGGLYPCDFYVLDEYRLGDIGDAPLKSAFVLAAEDSFRQNPLEKPRDCVVCRWKTLCQGGCKRDWVDTEFGPKNYYCGAFKQFFAYAEERLESIARAERQLLNCL